MRALLRCLPILLALTLLSLLAGVLPLQQGEIRWDG